MTAGFSSANTANKWLDVIRTGGANFTAAANKYAQIHTGDPGASGTANVSVGSTTRPGISHASPSAGSMSQNGTAPAWTNGGTSETITHVSVWDASSSGNFLFSFALSASKAWASGDTLTLTSSSVSLTPIAA